MCAGRHVKRTPVVSPAFFLVRRQGWEFFGGSCSCDYFWWYLLLGLSKSKIKKSFQEKKPLTFHWNLGSEIGILLLVDEIIPT